MYNLAITTAPANLAVTLAEAKDQLSIDSDDFQEQITRLIKAATSSIEQKLWRPLITQTLTLTLPGFPGDNTLPLPRPPIQSVPAIRYYADDDAEDMTVLTAGDYRLFKAMFDTPFVYMKKGRSWPKTADRPDAVEIDFVVGYGDASTDVPEDIRHAILLTVGHWWANREAVLTGTIATTLPNGVEGLIAPHVHRDPLIYQYEG